MDPEYVPCPELPLAPRGLEKTPTEGTGSSRHWPSSGSRGGQRGGVCGPGPVIASWPQQGSVFGGPGFSRSEGGPHTPSQSPGEDEPSASQGQDRPPKARHMGSTGSTRSPGLRLVLQVEDMSKATGVPPLSPRLPSPIPPPPSLCLTPVGTEYASVCANTLPWDLY